MAALALVLPTKRFKQKKSYAIQRFESPTSVKTAAKVLRVQNGKAARWNYQTGDYTEGIDYDAVKGMLAAGLMGITVTTRPSEAWRKLISPYKAGDKIVIKPNLVRQSRGHSILPLSRKNWMVVGIKTTPRMPRTLQIL